MEAIQGLVHSCIHVSSCKQLFLTAAYLVLKLPCIIPSGALVDYLAALFLQK